MERNNEVTADSLVRFFKYLSGPHGGHGHLVPVVDTMFPLADGGYVETKIRVVEDELQIIGTDGEWYVIDPYDAWKNYGIWLDQQIRG